MSAFKLSSPTVKPDSTLPPEHVFDGFGCTGKNISPALSWSGAPAGTRSFAVTVYDPDAPTQSGWWHWLVWNIPATATQLPQGAGAPSGQHLPAGAVQGRNDFGALGFGGAAPPPGPPHRYIFTVHALGVEKLEATPDSSAALISFTINANRLAQASITATYGRRP
ncbi:MAG: YbhB/YbcL family Raf kinase inhibitor-like protein [Steroidobacterales bacterium]